MFQTLYKSWKNVDSVSFFLPIPIFLWRGPSRLRPKLGIFPAVFEPVVITPGYLYTKMYKSWHPPDNIQGVLYIMQTPCFPGLYPVYMNNSSTEPATLQIWQPELFYINKIFGKDNNNCRRRFSFLGDTLYPVSYPRHTYYPTTIWCTTFKNGVQPTHKKRGISVRARRNSSG